MACEMIVLFFLFPKSFIYLFVQHLNTNIFDYHTETKVMDLYWNCNNICQNELNKTSKQC